MAFVAERQFIVATRETGYRTSSSAVAELVDNAIQARAQTIHIKTRTLDQADNNLEVAVVDDGQGMTVETLTQALRFGGTDRFDNRKGLGRFGMGLPNSSVSQARRVDVYSWQSRKRIHHSYLDVDDIAAGRMTDVVTVPNAVVPTWLDNTLPTTGTIVVWSKCDRLAAKRLEYFRERLRSALGRWFRYYIAQGTVITVDGVQVEAVDPLLCSVPANVKPAAQEVGRELIYEVASPRTPGQSSTIRVRFSQLPVRQWSDLPLDTKRGLGISKGAGVSVVRAGREIAYGWHFMGQKRKENYDDWWRCEIRFEPELDELFGVTHSKQGIRPSSELEAILSPDLERIAHDLNRRVRGEFTKVKTAGAPDASDVARKHDRLLAPLRHGVPLASKNRNGVNYKVSARAVPPDRFFVSKVAKGEVTVTINKAHPFYRVYQVAERDPGNAKFAIESLLLAMARAETTAKSPEQRDTLRKCLAAWSDNLAAFLRK